MVACGKPGLSAGTQQQERSIPEPRKPLRCYGEMTEVLRSVTLKKTNACIVLLVLLNRLYVPVQQLYSSNVDQH